MSMAAAPAHIDPVKVRAFLTAQPGVASIHDLHIWPMSTTEIALTCHIVMPAGHPGDGFLHELAEELGEHFGIRHPTVQIEVDAVGVCALAPDEVV
jgi:cobalt-zinc-cadmium efflux system protein